MSAYHKELEQLVERYQTENPGRVLSAKERNEDGSLNGTGARNLHTELCRLAGMTADQIVADWNCRSPEDPW